MRRSAVALAAACMLAGCGEPAPTPQEPAQFTVRGRWGESPKISYAIEIQTSPIDAVDCEAAIALAMKVWTDTGLVSFVPVEAGRKPDLTIGWRRGHHGACQPFGPGADVAHAGPCAPGTFVHFDLGHEWSAYGESGQSVYGTALHELGHVLGLGHSEAPEAVMSTDPQRPSVLSRHDLAGLHSLYGGLLSRDRAVGDLLIGPGTTALRGVAPPGFCGVSAFDCDGNGNDDLLVWRNDQGGHGALMVYQFRAGQNGPELHRTLGPFYGAVAPGAKVQFVKGPAGERLMVCKFDNGNSVVRQFDAHGIPGQPTRPPAAELLERAAGPLPGDFDGDGKTDIVIHAAARR